MSADLLRKAAATLRERAEGATPGPWYIDARGDNGVYTEARVSATSEDVAFATSQGDGKVGTDHYIATMHPGVGLALADWLDATADLWPLGVSDRLNGHAVALARLIVREQS